MKCSSLVVPFLFSSLALLGVASAELAVAQGCRPGDLELGRQETAEEIIVYCSKVSCEQISLRVRQDIAAQATLQHSLEENDADLKQWAHENEAAQRAALKDATDAIFRSLLAFSAEKSEQNIINVQNELNRRGHGGEAVATSLEKTGVFEGEYARWGEVSGGLKIRLTPGMSVDGIWVAQQEWAARAEKQRAALSSAWDTLSSDPEVRQILKDENWYLDFDSLNRGLKPLLAGSFDMARFLSSYGYDPSKWRDSGLQILRRTNQADTNVLAECKLGRLLRIDVRNMNVCNGRLPDPNASDPEAERCASGK